MLACPHVATALRVLTFLFREEISVANAMYRVLKGCRQLLFAQSIRCRALQANKRQPLAVAEFDGVSKTMSILEEAKNSGDSISCRTRSHSRASSPAPLRIELSAVQRHSMTLVLDLDETLVHSYVNILPSYRGPDFEVDVSIGPVVCKFFVYKRPHVDFFLQQVAALFNLVIYTASLREYGAPVVDFLDPGGELIKGRFFRDSCIHERGAYLKDIKLAEPNLARVAIVDNSPLAYSKFTENAIPIVTWIDDYRDDCLLKLLPILQYISTQSDVRTAICKLREVRS